MIYYVSNQTELIESDIYKLINVEESLQLLKDCKVLQYDSETDSLDCHIGNLLCIQFGSKEKDFQIVVDCTTVNVKLYKEVLENSILIGHNLKFDLQWLYNYHIIPRKIYDTMIVEQLLYLGFPHITLSPEEYQKYEYDFPYLIDDKNNYTLSYSLKALAFKYLNINMDKTIRGNIIYEGLSDAVIQYSSSDVKYLEDIMELQMKECVKKECTVGAKLECSFVPAIAYLEWCGIKLDEKKWKAKMSKDSENLKKAKSDLDDFIVRNNLKQFYKINNQGDLFSGFCLDPVITINWSSSKQVINVAKILGFNTKVQDKKTGQDKDSVLEKHLKSQKGINDEFLDLYFKYQEYAKVCTTYGQGHLNTINPITGRSHTVYNQLKTASGRLSCGSTVPNKSLAKLNKVNPSDCTYPNYQQLPSDEITRSCFVADKGNLIVSADFNAEESRLAADIYQDKEMLKEFLEGSGDMHSLFAWMVFRKECEDSGCTCVADVKSKAPKWRKAVKSVEFAWLFGAAAPTISQAANCTIEEAQNYINSLEKGFSGVHSFAKKGSEFVRKNGYIVICPLTGHKKWWWDFKKWKERQESFTQEFWEDYRNNHKGTCSQIALEVRNHFQAVSKYDRDARNVVTQGTGSIIMKDLMINLFNWIVDNDYFNKIKIVASVHDEVVIEFPEQLEDSFPKLLESIMETSAAKYCKSLPIPAEGAVDICWRH